jgi:hypothetical protein
MTNGGLKDAAAYGSYEGFGAKALYPSPPLRLHHLTLSCTGLPVSPPATMPSGPLLTSTHWR